MNIPYKYELKQLRTPHLNEDGEEVPSAPKRIALLSKLTLLPKSRYKSRECGGTVSSLSLCAAFLFVGSVSRDKNVVCWCHVVGPGVRLN